MWFIQSWFMIIYDDLRSMASTSSSCCGRSIPPCCLPSLDVLTIWPPSSGDNIQGEFKSWFSANLQMNIMFDDSLHQRHLKKQLVASSIFEFSTLLRGDDPIWGAKIGWVETSTHHGSPEELEKLQTVLLEQHRSLSCICQLGFIYWAYIYVYIYIYIQRKMDLACWREKCEPEL